MTVRLRAALKEQVLKSAQLLGRYLPSDAAVEQDVTDLVFFDGDNPLSTDKFFTRIRYVEGKITEQVGNLWYTQKGMSFHNGKLVEGWSSRQPSMKEIFGGSRAKTRGEINSALIIESKTPYTYGDWVSEHLLRIANHEVTTTPLLLPKHFKARSYVSRDLERLGVPYKFADDDTLIKSATILRKERPSHFFLPDEIQSFRLRLRVPQEKPEAGSLLYLSRSGVQSEALQRDYQSDETRKIITRLGGKTINTASAGLSEYLDAAQQAETVVADFGSAILNLLYWNSKKLIIIYTPDWIDMAPFFLCKGLNIKSIHLIDLNQTPTTGALEQKIKNAIATDF